MSILGPHLRPKDTPEWKAKFGGYNQPPPNLKPCTASEFWQYFSTYGLPSSNQQEFRQFVIPGDERMSSVHLYHTAGDQGFAIVVDWIYTQRNLATGEEARSVYTPRFFKFAVCEHDVVHSRKLGNCYNEYKCTKCDWTFSVDSSG